MPHCSQALNQGQRHASDPEDATDEHLAGSKQELGGTEKPSSSSLENLPAELRALILLNAPDLPTLYALVHASPVMHAQYLKDRTTILRACMDRELHGFAVDAYFTATSRTCMIKPLRTDDIIVDFIYNYRLLYDSPIPMDLNSVNPRLLRWMAGFHLRYARPLARLYSNWALSNLRRAIASEAGHQEAEATETETETTKSQAAEEVLKGGAVAQDDPSIKLSRSEEIRLFRALYRSQTFHHLFGRNQVLRLGALCDFEINELFCSIFHPWDIEAIGCIDIFIRAKYDDIFNRVKADLHPDNPKFMESNGVSTSVRSYDLEAEHYDYMDGIVSRGVKMALRLLEQDDHEKLVSLTSQWLCHASVTDYPLREVLSSLAQDQRREMFTTYPTNQDKRQKERESMPFFEDAFSLDIEAFLPLSTPVGDPPFGWVTLWGGKYANIYGEYVPKSLRQWGYVMWDKSRWIEMGADESLIKGQWEMSPDLVKKIKDTFDWSPMEP